MWHKEHSQGTDDVQTSRLKQELTRKKLDHRARTNAQKDHPLPNADEIQPFQKPDTAV